MSKIEDKFEAFFSSDEEIAELNKIIEMSNFSEQSLVPITVQTVVVTEEAKTIKKEEVRYV